MDFVFYCYILDIKKILIKSIYRPTKDKDDYHYLDREQQVIIFRLRTGHNRLNKHMCSKLHLADSPSCNCGQGDQNAEHILQSCPRLQVQRKEVWPLETPLNTKLYGCRDELAKTAQFVLATCLSV